MVYNITFHNKIMQYPTMMEFPQMPQVMPAFQMPPAIPVMPIVYEPKELRILVLSDIHVHGGHLNNLASWLKATKPNYDMVFLMGNMSNMINRLRNNFSAENEASEQLVSIIKFLNDYVSKPVFYIPGNTEPSGIYNSMYEIPGGINLHKKAVQLDEGLVAIGLGGSIPVKKEDKDILEGFPYQSEDEFKKDLTACVESVKMTFGPNANVLLLTHMGPAESGTAKVYLGKDEVNGGCKGFDDAIKDIRFIGHIHGHSAISEGLSKPFGPSIPVINPGGLVSGRFGEISIRRGTDGVWKIADAGFKNLE